MSAGNCVDKFPGQEPEQRIMAEIKVFRKITFVSFIESKTILAKPTYVRYEIEKH
jgi:hypothetical protein